MTSRQGPIFVVGCGRSGTSLLRRMLNQHSEIGIPLESLFISDYLKASAWQPLGRMLPMLVREPEIEEWGIAARLEDVEGCENISQAIDRLHGLYLAKHGKRRWGQKTPRFVRQMDLIQQHFPDVRFVHLVRDPRAVVSSLIRSNVHRSNATFAARRWKMDVTHGLAYERRQPAAVLRISYENLVDHPEAVMRQVCAFAGIGFEPEMLQPTRRSEPEYSVFYSGIHANLDRPPTSEFVDRWAEDLNSDEVAVVESIAGETMVELGYIPVSSEPLRRVSSLRAQAERGVGLAQQLLRYVRYRPRYLLFLLRRKARLGLLREFLWTVNY